MGETAESVSRIGVACATKHPMHLTPLHSVRQGEMIRTLAGKTNTIICRICTYTQISYNSAKFSFLRMRSGETKTLHKSHKDQSNKG